VKFEFLKEFLRGFRGGYIVQKCKSDNRNKFKNEPNREILHSSKINSKI